MTALRRAAAAGLLVALLAASSGKQDTTPEMLLVAEAVATLEAWLADRGVDARVEAAEEGSFMLGAYPRSDVLWRIRLQQPASADELDDLAAQALRLRAGGVWISVPARDGPPVLHAYKGPGEQ